MLKGRNVELVCGDCGAVFAAVRVRALAGRMDVTDIVGGFPIMPRPGYSVNEDARQHLARAEARSGDGRVSAEIEDARGVVDYLRRHGGEIIYDLGCRCRRRFIRSSPGLRREIARTKGRWVTLSVGTATWGPPPED